MAARWISSGSRGLLGMTPSSGNVWTTGSIDLGAGGMTTTGDDGRVVVF
jgi:hypothetical protein